MSPPLLLIKNASLWKWNMNSVSSAPTGGFEDNSWVSVDQKGIISSVGTQENIPDSSNYVTVLDAKGGLLLPGLTDSHIHVGMVGETSTFLLLGECNSILDLQLALRRHCHKRYEQSNSTSTIFVIGVQWEQSRLSRYPTRYDLDEALSSDFGINHVDPSDTMDYSNIPV